MAERQLKLTSLAPAPSTIVLLDGQTATGWSLLGETQWGSASWQAQQGGLRGTQGRRVAAAIVESRQVTLALRATGASADAVKALLVQLGRVVEEVRQFGGLLTWREGGATYRQYLDLFDSSGVVIAVQTPAGTRVDATVGFTAAPFFTGDPLDYADSFATDTVTSGEWTLDSGSGVVVAAHQLAVTSTGVKRLRLVGPGYALDDAQLTVRFQTGASVASLSLCVALRGDTTGADTMVALKLTPTTVAVVKRVAGVETTLQSTAWTPAAGTVYFARFRCEGSVCTAELFNGPGRPTPLGAPAVTATTTLSAADRSTFARGHAVLRINPVDTAEVFDDVELEAFTYRSVLLPEVLRLGGAIPGDAPALADVRVTASTTAVGSGSGTGSGGRTYPVYALLGWAKRRSGSLIGNGDFDQQTTARWSGAAVTNIVASANTISSVTTWSRYGTTSLQTVTANLAAGEGCSTSVQGRFKAGRTYLAFCWVRAASGTANVQLRLGSTTGTDRANGTATALSTTPKLLSVAWTPTADREDVYVAVVTSAQAAQTFTVDAVVVLEAQQQTTLSAAISTTSQTTAAVAAQLEDAPPAPWYALIEQELVLVDDASTLTWSVDRGAEGTTAATHASGTPVYLITRDQYVLRGESAPPPVGMIQASEAYSLATWAVTTDSEYVGSSGLQATASGAGTASARFPVDANLVDPDAYTQGDVDVSVYARVELDGDLKRPRIALGAFGWGRGVARYSEFGSVGKTLTAPGDTNQDFRFVYLGTVTLSGRQATSSRWWLQLDAAWDAASTGVFGVDYLVLVPRRGRANSPERRLLDAAYPEAFENASGGESTRLWTSELAGWASREPQPLGSAPGLGGTPIELAPGHNDLTVKLCSMVPDNADTTQIDSEYRAHTATVHVAVTPRYTSIRG